MAEVASRDLRNNTKDVLDRVAAGEDVTITVGGRAVAKVVPLERKPRWIDRSTFFSRLRTAQADAALATELDALAPGTTDDFDPS
jgi:prevent-host-death family protein